MALHKRYGRVFSAFASAGLALSAPSAFGGSMQDVVEILVPRTVIYPGTTLSSDLVQKLVVRDNSQLATAFTSSDQLTGLVARRTLIPGQPITKEAVRTPTLVQQGQPVTVHYTDGPIAIALGAVALQSGGVGDNITVRNGDTGRILRALVRADGSLVLGSP